MKKSNFFTSLLLAGVLMFAQVSAVFAAPTRKAAPIIGIVQTITLEADPNTGVTTVVVVVLGTNGDVQTVRLSLETATELGLVILDGDGKPVINQLALGQQLEIDPDTVITEEKQNAVGSALSTFFSDIDGLDYSIIMEAHGLGNGFGLIAQALWLTLKLEGSAQDFLAILEAKKNNDFSGFILADGSSPKSWGELKKAIMDGDKKGNLGLVMSNQGNENGNSEKNGNKGKDKDNSGNGKGKKP